MSSSDQGKPRFEPPTYGSAGPSLPPQSAAPPYAPSPPYGYYSAPPVAPRTNAFAIGALASCFVFPFVLPMVLGIVGLKQISDSNGAQKGTGLAIAGIVVGGLLGFGLLVGLLGG